ncbi:MAG: hypothetical protein V7K47_03945 [Nostoc sp.]
MLLFKVVLKPMVLFDHNADVRAIAVVPSLIESKILAQSAYN